jgi:hypothetical protein
LEPLQRHFLVDGLDEKLSKEEGTIHQLLAQSEHLFPSWLKLIATSRETSIITGAFSDPVILKFERHDKRNLSDITQIVTNIIEGRAPGHTVVLARNGATSAKRRCNGQTWLWWHNDKRLTTTSRFAGRSISGFRRVHFQSLPKLPPLVPAAALFAFDQRCNSSSSSSSRPTSSVRPAAIAAPCQEAPRL